MVKLILTASVFFCLSSAVLAQTVFDGGILNAASSTYPTLPGGSIAQGSMFVVYGSDLGTTDADLSHIQLPLPTTLPAGTGTSIKVTSGGTTVDAFMIYTTPGQVAAMLPSNTPTGAATLTLTYQGKSSSVSVNVVGSSFGAFTLNQAGSGPAIIQDFVTPIEQPVNTIVNPAYPGQTVTLWGTGLGPVSGAEAATPLPGDMKDALGVKVWVGNQPVTVNYAGRSGCCVGIDQVQFVVPQGIQGCYLPVVVQAGGVVSNFTSMAVSSSAGATCSDADGIASADVNTLQSAGKVRLGIVDLIRISLKVNAGQLGTINALSDTASAIFGEYSTTQLSDSLGLTQSPSVGGCFVSQFQGLNPIPVDPTTPSALDAGAALSISGAAGNKAIASTSTGFYAATLGGVPVIQLLTGTPTPAYFSPGSYTISGTGGSAAGSFSEQFTIPTDVTWTNPIATDVDRTKDLTITWSNGDPNSFTVISGIGVAATGPLGPSTTTPGRVFLCVAPASAGTFTVPSVVLQTLPPTSTVSLVPTSFLLVGTQTSAEKFSATGLDDGYVMYRSLTGTNIKMP